MPTLTCAAVDALISQINGYQQKVNAACAEAETYLKQNDIKALKSLLSHNPVWQANQPEWHQLKMGLLQLKKELSDGSTEH